MRLLKFLLVDDEPMNLASLEGILFSFGLRNVKKAFNGQQALEVLKESQFNFDVILTDYHMPEMDGV
jgi:YesN/AraC family two-component response regulator